MSTTLPPSATTRYLRRGRTAERRAVTAMPAMTAEAYAALQVAPWQPTTTLESDLPQHDWSQTGHRSEFDVYKFCGDFESADMRQHAYAGAVCYALRLPFDAHAGAACDIVSVALTAYADRWLGDGVIIAALPSTDPEPPADWADVLADPLADTGAIMAVIPSNAGTDSTATPTITLPASTAATPYVHLMVRLADYETHRGAWIEGGARIIASSIQVTYSRTVTADDAAEDTDGDLMPDQWEIAHGLDPQTPDGAQDADADGWSNLSEFCGGSHPADATSVPLPALNLRVSYPGAIGSGPLRINCYSIRSMDGEPDAQFVIPLDAVRGRIPFDADLSVREPTLGHLREGPCWMWAWIGGEQYNPDTMPAGLALGGPIQISWGTVNVDVALRDVAFGFPRFSWTGSERRNVTIRWGSDVGDILFRKTIYNRNYIHEGDLAYLNSSDDFGNQRYGLTVEAVYVPLYWWESAPPTGAAASGTFAFDWSNSEADNYTPRIEPSITAPSSDELLRRAAGLARLEWVADARNAAFFVEVREDTNLGVVVYDGILPTADLAIRRGVVRVPLTTGHQPDATNRYALLLRAVSAHLAAGTYAAQVTVHVPATPASPYNSEASAWHIFEIDHTEDAAVGPWSISGTFAYAGAESDPVVVEAFRRDSPAVGVDGLIREGFAGHPVARTVAADPTQPWEITGLLSGQYVIRAYIDSASQGHPTLLDTQGWAELANGRVRLLTVGPSRTSQIITLHDRAG